MLHPQFKRLTVLCPEYNKDCITATKRGSFSSMHMFMATSRCLNLHLRVFYPGVNGCNTYNFKTLNTELRPKFADPDKGILGLMWTSVSLPNSPPTSQKPCKADHIVPLVVGVRGPTTSLSYLMKPIEERKTIQRQQFASPNKFEVLQEEVVTIEDTIEDIDEKTDRTRRNKLKKDKPAGINADKKRNMGKKDNQAGIKIKEDSIRNRGKKDKQEGSKEDNKEERIELNLEEDMADEEEINMEDNDDETENNHEGWKEDNKEERMDFNMDEEMEDEQEVKMEENNDERMEFEINDEMEDNQECNMEHGGNMEDSKEEHEEGQEGNMEDNIGSSIDEEMEDEQEWKQGPLGNKFMEIGELIRVLSGPHTVLDEVPIGRKNGNYYVIDNVKNTERREQGKRSEFWDDCGTWTKGMSPTYTFTLKDDRMVTIHRRKDLGYCVERQKAGKKSYEALHPQPQEEDLLTIKRLYNTHSSSDKGPTQFRRRCTWVLNAPSSMSHLPLDVALVEYVGVAPKEKKPHGNSVTNKDPYIRTKPAIRQELIDRLKTDDLKDVRDHMNSKTRDENNKQRNEKQLWNIKWNQKKKTNNIPSNAADQILYVQEMLKTHPFVQGYHEIKGLNHPAIVLYTDQQIVDVKRFCCAGNTPLGVDKTYNLGDFHVTPTVYKDLSVIRKSTKQHPITFGPTFIHTSSTTKTYNLFLHNLADNLDKDEITNLTIGSDEEKAFKTSISRCLQGATHVLCTQHFKKNINKYMEEKVGISKDKRKTITDAIFGDQEGLTYSRDVDTYNYRLERVKEKIEEQDMRHQEGDKKFMPYFVDKVIPNLKEHVIDPANKGKIERGWTNNNCESANHILKTATHWKQSELPKFIEKLYSMVTGEENERCRAIRGCGDFSLDKRYEHHLIDREKWGTLSEDIQIKREKRFLADRGKNHPSEVTSTNGLKTVCKTPNAGKKLNQQNRKRANRTRTAGPPAKRALIT